MKSHNFAECDKNTSIRYSAEQLKIIKHDRGYANVIAGAGTGKTSTLLAVVRHLLPKKHKILVLTYNKHTVNEIKSRLGLASQNVTITDFHAFGFKVIKRYYAQLGFTSPFLHVVPADGNPESNEITYQKMLDWPLELFKDKSVLREVASNYTCLLVDEVQDINKSQRQLISKLFTHIRLGWLFGDSKQTIYGFRGADSKHLRILNKKLHFTTYALTNSYRLTSASTKFANAFASFSDDPPLASTKKGLRPVIYRFKNSDEQSDYIECEIQRLVSKGVDYNEIVILFRENQALLNLRNALEVRGIAVDYSYSSEQLKWCRFLRSLIIVTKWVKSNYSRKTPFNCLDYIKELIDEDVDIERIIKDGIKYLRIKKPNNNRLNAYRRLIALRQAIIRAANVDYADVAIQILIDALLKYARYYDVKVKFIIPLFSKMKVMSKNMSFDQVKMSNFRFEETTGVKLMTIHQAKSKEWDYVFLPHIIDGVYPNHQALNSEIEHCLFYTAITRHRKCLYLLETPMSKIKYNSDNKFKRKKLASESNFVADNVKHVNDYRLKLHNEKWGN